MNRKSYRGIAATTHRDTHGDRFTKEALDRSVEEFQSFGEPLWCFWDHQTTLPPIQLIHHQEVEKRSDGEYQLVVEGILFEEENFEYIDSSKIIVPELSDDKVREIFPKTKFEPSDLVVILYDPRNFEPADANSTINSLSEIYPTQSNIFLRKAELPEPVIYVLGAFLTGFIARFGEITADKAIEMTKELALRFRERFESLLATSKSEQPTDIIFQLPLHDTNTLVEGAVEGIMLGQKDKAWETLPELYALAHEVINNNRKDLFSHVKFLFNPSTNKWEVNYLITRMNHRVILGPRYSDSSHPLHKRWEDECQNFNEENLEDVSMSVGFIPIEVELEKE